MSGRKAFITALLVASTSLGAGSLAFAQSSNREKHSAFKTTGTTDFTTVEQGGSKAEAIKATLAKIKVPEGFKIDLYAIVPDARHMAGGVGIEVEDDRAPAQRRAPAHPMRRIGQRQEFRSRDRQRQYVAVVKRRAHGFGASDAPCLPPFASASRASARRSAITLLSAPLVAASAG